MDMRTGLPGPLKMKRPIGETKKFSKEALEGK